MPILAYHATYAEDFERFDFDFCEDIGFHFGSRETANTRVHHLLEEGDVFVEGTRILVCHLDIAKPLRLPDCHTWGGHNVMIALRDAGVLSGEQLDRLWDDGYFGPDEFRDTLEAAGYDSAVYANITEGGGDSYIVIRPEHIRFALADGLMPAAAPPRRLKRRP